MSLDFVNVVLVFLNQVGLCHPSQTFSYILKLRLEFLVLNQLMAVAARGWRRETFGEKRYHNPQALRNFSTFGPALQDIGITDPGAADDKERRRRDPIITALPSISPQGTIRQPSFPAATVEPPLKDAGNSVNSADGEKRRSWPPITYNHLKHMESGEERMLRETREAANRMIWRSDEDEPEEDNDGT